MPFWAIFCLTGDATACHVLKRAKGRKTGIQICLNKKRKDKAQLMRDTSDNKKKLIRELNTLRCHSL